MSQELHQLLSELVQVWPDDHNHPVVDRAREYLEVHGSATDSDEGYHQMTAYDGWKPNATEVWYSL
jgi:hypothetical protein